MSPSYKARLAYFKSKLKAKDKPEKWAKATKNMSFASLAELIIGVQCFNETFEETLGRLKNTKSAESEDGGGGSMGFTKSK